MPMSNPPHPGLSVRYDCLEPLGLSVSEAAEGLGVSRKRLSNVVNGRAGISPEWRSAWTRRSAAARTPGIASKPLTTSPRRRRRRPVSA